jgi:RNA polymerase sigma-70 factor (ECF subfamily)
MKVNAAILKQVEQKAEAQQAYSRAIGLTEDATVRKFLLHQSSLLDE